jgi:hypothetical protein
MSLNKFLARQKEINKTVAINEARYHSRFYRFAHELAEDDEVPVDEPAEEPVADAGAPLDAPAGPEGGEDMPDTGSAEDPGAGAAGDELGGDGTDVNLDNPVDPMADPNADPLADGGEVPPAEPDTEIDVTELVNGTQEVSQKVDNVVMKLDQNNQQITSIIQSIEAIAPMLQNMQSAVNSLSHQVELMRPPTEEERRKVVKKTSYPFNQDLNDYNSGVGPQTQTDMENNLNALSQENLASTFNDKEIKDTF